MNSNKRPLYVGAIIVGAGLGLWAGLPPFILIFLAACTLMMFFMMRGGNHGGNAGHSESDASHGAQRGSQPTRSSDLDGSHQHTDRP